MTEKQFTDVIFSWVKRIISQSHRRKGVDAYKKAKIYTGSIPWYESENTKHSDWAWKEFQREIDIVIGLKARFPQEGESLLVPLITIELKTGALLNTDELDKKSAIYGPLREVYPWVYNIFIHQNIQKRGMKNYVLFRNARHFNSIYTEWKGASRKYLKKEITQRLNYIIEYWEIWRKY